MKILPILTIAAAMTLGAAAAEQLHPNDSLAAQRADALHEQFRSFWYYSLDSAARYAEGALSAAREARDSARMARGYWALGYAFTANGKPRSGLDSLERGIALTRSCAKAARFLPGLLNEAGIACVALAEHSRGLTHLLAYAELAQAQGDSLGLAEARNNIGWLYFDLGDLITSLHYYQKALQAYGSAPAENEFIARLRKGDYFAELRATTLTNAAQCYAMLEEGQQALALLGALHRADQAGALKPQLSCMLRAAQALAQCSLANFTAARQELDRGLAIAGREGLDKLESWLVQISVDVDIELGKAQSALAALGKARNLDDFRSLWPMYNRERSAVIHDALGRTAKAARDWRIYVATRQQLMRPDQIHRMAIAQAAYEERANVKKIENQEEMLSFREHRLKLQLWGIGALAALGVILMAVSALLRYMYVHKRSAYKGVELENEELKKTALSFDAQMNEKRKETGVLRSVANRISVDLDRLMYRISHDIRGPVATIKGLCQLGMTAKKSEAIEYFKMADKTVASLDSILIRMQRTVEINSAHIRIAQTGLATAVKEAWDEMIIERKRMDKDDVPSHVEVNYQIDEKIFVRTDKKMLKYIAGAALDNAVKFCRSSYRGKTAISVSARETAHYTELRIADNGAGFPKGFDKQAFELFARGDSNTSNTGGLGLYIANLASRRIGAKLSLNVGKNGGAEFLARIPKKFNVSKYRFKGKNIAAWRVQGR